MASETEYDLIVIGSGPGGQKAALAAAKLGKKVAIVEHGHMVGGVCANTGTIPSKTLREAVLHLTGMNQRELYGASYRVKEHITPADLHQRTSHVIDREVDVIRNQLMRNHVDLHIGNGSFVGGGTPLLPQADPSDGELDIAVSYTESPRRRIAYAWHVRRGDHHRRDDVVYLRGAEVSVHGDELACTSDGELSGPRSEHSWRIEPAALTMYVP
jgi:choline dehydrogenase-like flavoprotein